MTRNLLTFFLVNMHVKLCSLGIYAFIAVSKVGFGDTVWRLLYVILDECYMGFVDHAQILLSIAE